MKKCIAVLMLLVLLATVAVPAFADGNVTYDAEEVAVKEVKNEAD